MRQVTLRIIAVGTSIIVSCLSLFAQESTLRDRDRTFEASRRIATDLRKARFHSGAFYLLSNVELADIGYSSALFAPVDTADDGVTIGLRAPQRLYWVPSKKQFYSIEVTPQYSFGTARFSDGQAGYLVRGDAQYVLNHLYLDLYGVRANEARTASSEINRLATVSERTGGVAGEFRYSSKTSATFSASARSFTYPQQRLQPEDVDLQRLARDEQNFRLSLHHKTFPLTALFVASELSNYDFRSGLLGHARRTYGGFGAERDNGRAYVKAEIGAAKLDFHGVTNNDYSGAVGNVNGHYIFTARTQLSATGGRDLEFSTFGANDYYVMDHGNVTLTRQATRKLTLNASSSLVHNSYPVAALEPISGRFARRRDVIAFNSVGWLYTVRRLSGGFDLGYYTRHSNFPVEGRDGIRIVLHLSFTP